MANKDAFFFGFNRGLMSRLALARVDMDRLAFSAETMDNWMPRVLGSMMLRPGLGYIGATASNNQARFLPFIFSTDDTALIELTDSLMRVWVDDVLVTRVSVASVTANGNFDTTLNSWTDNDEVGGTSAWQTGGYMGLTGDGTNAAIRDQTVTVAGGDLNKQHALRIVVQRGPVTFMVGTSAGDDSYVATTDLDTGYHSLAFTPTGNFFIRFQSIQTQIVLVDSCNVEAAGVMTIPAPWTAAFLRLIRIDQSGDIIFVACKGFLQRKIERRGTYSWSLVWYLTDNGPYLTENKTETTISPSALNGNVTLTSSRGVFLSGHIGCLFRIRSVGQRVSSALVAQNTFTSTIECTGVGEARRFAITITGVFVATVTLQRSVGVAGNWVDVTTFTTTQATTYADALDNQLVFYRIGIKTGAYTSGTATCTLDYPLGSITGVCRVTGFTSATSVAAEVLTDFGSTTGSKFWSEGSWSTLSGFPTALAFYEGRLWFAGKNGIFGSVSDDFYNFDPDTIGDSGPINRTVGSGPVDDINWILPLQRLIIGAEGAEHSIRATSFDEVLTPSNFNIKEASSQGSTSALAVKIDSRGVFVQRGGSRLFELAFDANLGDYASTEATIVIPEVGEPSIVHVGVQRLPDTRVHCVRSDGVVAILVYNPAENVLCWSTVSTDGDIEDVVVLPGDVEDSVYYCVNRTIGGVTKRYLERWALESEARGGLVSNISDAYLTYSGAAVTTLSGLSHLEGKVVCVWGNGIDLGTATVVGGAVGPLSQAVTTATVGLPYIAQWKSTKLVHATANMYGSRKIQIAYGKRITQVGFMLADYYAGALKFGPDFDTLDDMPLIERDLELPVGTLSTDYENDLIEFPGMWDSNSRVCLEATGPRPVTVLAIVLAYESEDKS